jgi:hypothetical protein
MSPHASVPPALREPFCPTWRAMTRGSSGLGWSRSSPGLRIVVTELECGLVRYGHRVVPSAGGSIAVVWAGAQELAERLSGGCAAPVSFASGTAVSTLLVRASPMTWSVPPRGRLTVVCYRRSMDVRIPKPDAMRVDELCAPASRTRWLSPICRSMMGWVHVWRGRSGRGSRRYGVTARGV